MAYPALASRRRAIGLSHACALCALIVTSAASARADKFDETVDVELRVGGSWIHTHELALRPTVFDPGPAALEGLAPNGEPGPPAQLDGDGRSFGASLRAGVSLDGVRFGAGVGGLGTGGVGLSQPELGSHFAFDAPSPWALNCEVYAGYAFGSARSVRPYFEVRGVLDVFFTRATLAHDELGSLGSTTLYAAAPGVSLAAGLLLPLSQYFFADVGMSVEPYGAERLTLFGALGLPIPMANL